MVVEGVGEVTLILIVTLTCCSHATNQTNYVMTLTQSCLTLSDDIRSLSSSSLLLSPERTRTDRVFPSHDYNTVASEDDARD